MLLSTVTFKWGARQAKKKKGEDIESCEPSATRRNVSVSCDTSAR